MQFTMHKSKPCLGCLQVLVKAAVNALLPDCSRYITASVYCYLYHLWRIK